MSYAKRLSARFLPCLFSSLLLLAAAAVPAQAEGNWFINGKALAGLTPSVTWEQDSSVFGFLLPNLNLELVFKKSNFTFGTLNGEGKGTAEFTFSEGKVNSLSEELEELPCTVGDLKFSGPTNLFLHEGKTYNAMAINTITTYGAGTGCPLSTKNTVAGTIVLEDTASFGEEALERLIKVVPNGLFPTLTLKFGALPVTLDGSWIMRLTGAHKGLEWSGIG